MPSVNAGSANGDRPPDQLVERRERRRAHPEDARRALLQSPVLPEVEAAQRGGEGEAREGGQDEPDVERRGRRRRTRVRAGSPPPAGRPASTKQRGGERHHGEAEQPERRPAAPDQVRRRRTSRRRGSASRPRIPHGKPSALDGLRDEQRGLREPAEAHAPDRVPDEPARPDRLADVGERGLRVAGERRPERGGAQLRPSGHLLALGLLLRPRSPCVRRASSASSATSRSSRASLNE